MYKYVINGGYPLSGSVRISGNKNAALPCIAATLLTDKKVTLKNLPEIEDVNVMIDVLKELGVKVEHIDKGVFSFETTDIKSSTISSEHAAKIRASILFAGPLLARTGKVVMAPPGGDVIGRRRLDTHFMAFNEFGATVEVDGDFILSANKLIGVDMFLDEASVTATENAIMVAVLAEGETIINNAASEPHVQDLCKMLVKMGAKIEGIGSNILRIEGVKKLHGAQFSIGADFMEVGSFIGLAAVTKSELLLENTCPQDLRMTKLGFSKLGINWKVDGNNIIIPRTQELKVQSDFGGMIPKIDDAPWPGFPADLTSIMTVVATQIEGTVLIHEKMFESRMFFVDKLIGMGAKIVLCDPHRAVVTGPARLQGAQLTSPDVRAGMAMIIAALCANGKSEIQNVYQIERGYENIVEKLKNIGAKIKRTVEK